MFQLVNLGLDGSIACQDDLGRLVDTTLNLSDLHDKLRLFGLDMTVSQARARITNARLKSNLPWLTLIGSGDFNHLSALLIETLPLSARPLNLVLFDNHPDWFQLPPRYHCGNWVGTLLRYNWIESVTLIGQDSDDLEPWNFHFAPHADLESGRVTMYPYRRRRSQVLWRRLNGGTSPAMVATPFGSELSFTTFADAGRQAITDALTERLEGRNVYVAIDKDVLSPKHAVCDWEQGRLELDDLLYMLNALSKKTRIVGADICGERAPHPLKGFFKRLDAGRLAQPLDGPPAQSVPVNETTNLAIVELLLKTAAIC